MAQLLDDPRIVKVYDFGLIEENWPFIVMEMVNGQTLASMVRKGGMPLNTVIEIFKPLCLALNYAHSQGLVHRDIKPSNITTSEPDSNSPVKIIDFGIATVLTADSGDGLTKTGDVFGTPSYMSPEQCQGIAVDARSDIYSLGCVLFEALAGLPPFRAIHPCQR